MTAARLLVSLDWGGTKVAGVVVDLDAGTNRKFVVPATNLRMASSERVVEILRAVCAAAAVKPSAQLWWGCGAAGGRPGYDTERLVSALRELGGSPEQTVVLWNDAQTGFAAAFGDADGILSINGTGCILWGRREKAEERRGGWGYLLDETPSGAYFGTLAARGILAAWEGSGETAHVARAYAEKFADAPQDRAGLLTDLYSSASIQGRVAVLAPLFTAAVDAESAWARYHLAQSLQHWVRDLKSLAKAVGFKPTITTKVVGIGGLWSGWPGFRARAVRVMEQTWPGEFTLTEPLLAPEWGPLVLARDTFGLSIADLQHFNR